MNRREFFRNSLQEVSKAAVRVVDEHLSNSASHWIRPPYAQAELEFLLACTRCDKCIEACPHQVIFSLPLRCSAQIAGTPAMDLQNKACHLCDDWPCVKVCEPGALLRPLQPEGEKVPFPSLAVAEINTSTCLPYTGPECGACASCCPVPGAMTWEMGKPSIEPTRCCGCALCREHCIVEPKAINIRSLHRQKSVTGNNKTYNTHEE